MASFSPTEKKRSACFAWQNQTTCKLFAVRVIQPQLTTQHYCTVARLPLTSVSTAPQCLVCTHTPQSAHGSPLHQLLASFERNACAGCRAMAPQPRSHKDSQRRAPRNEHITRRQPPRRPVRHMTSCAQRGPVVEFSVSTIWQIKF